MMKRTKIEWVDARCRYHRVEDVGVYRLGHATERRALEIAINRGAQGEVVITHLDGREVIAEMRRYVS